MSIRRLATSLSLVVAVATAPLLATPAARADTLTNGQISVVSEARLNNGPCSSGTTATKAAAFTGNGHTAAESTSSSSTVTNTSDASDTTRVTASVAGAAQATISGGRIREVDMTTSMRLADNPAQGTSTNCATDAGAQVNTSFMFAVSHATRLAFTAELTSPGSQATIQVVTGSGPTAIQDSFSLKNGASETRHDMVLPPGSYQMVMSVLNILPNPTTTADAVTRHSTPSVRVSFALAGSASTPTSGTGRSFVALAGQRVCGKNGHLSTTFRSAAGAGPKKAIKKASFRVDGKVVKTVTSPPKGRVVLVKPLDDAREETISVKLVLTNGTTKTVSRSYYACT